MNCEQIRNLLRDFADGNLDGEKSRAVRVHLASCAACASMLSPADRMEILPALDDEIEPSENFTARFYARLQERSRDRQRGSLWRRIAAWEYPWKLAAAGVLVIILVAGIFSRYPGGRSEPPESLNDFPLAEDLPLAEELPLLQDMAVISHLDLLENFDAIEMLTKEEREEK